MNEKKQTYSGFLRGLAVGFGIAFAVVLIFAFGVFVGEQKARFSYRWGENYNRDFGGPPPMGGFGRPQGFFGGHGAAGRVIKKAANKLYLRGPDNAEKIILLDKKTYIIKGRQRIKLKDIKEDSEVVVMGSPDKKGRIKARLIRVFDPKAWKESMWERKNTRPLPPLFL